MQIGGRSNQREQQPARFDVDQGGLCDGKMTLLILQKTKDGNRGKPWQIYPRLGNILKTSTFKACGVDSFIYHLSSSSFYLHHLAGSVWLLRSSVWLHVIVSHLISYPAFPEASAFGAPAALVGSPDSRRRQLRSFVRYHRPEKTYPVSRNC